MVITYAIPWCEIAVAIFVTSLHILKLRQFSLPRFVCGFRKSQYKAVVPFNLVSMPGEVKDPARGVTV